jgi:UDP-2,3-diacylglucosamine pyrophosphatase LpxH
MSIQDCLDEAFKNSLRIKITKAIEIGDLHLGVRDNADDFDGHDDLLISGLEPYFDNGFTLLLGGDVTDDWECQDRSKIVSAYPAIWRLIKKFRQANRLYQVSGNHDPDLSLPVAYILITESGKEILWTHGHIGDFFNSQGSWLGKFFVRYIWRNLQMTGIFKDPTTATMRNPKKHEATRVAFLDWAQTRKKEVIYQHTHFGIKGPSWNGGSWVGNGGQGIEIVGDKITLKIFKGG